jgi:ATP/ADP translocase
VTSSEIRSRALHVALPIFWMTTAFFLAKTGRDALYFQGRGLLDLPAAYIVMALLSLPVAFLVLAAMRGIGSRRARLVVPLAVAVLLAATAQVARPGGGWLMTGIFVLVPLAFGVLFSLFWLLAADLLDAAPGPALAEAYGWIGAASIAGGMAGSGLARLLAARIEPARFLSLGALALVAAVAAAAMAQRRFPQRQMTAPAGPSRPSHVDMGAVLRQPYGTLLLGTGMAASLVGMLVEFQFYLAAATSGADGRANARFFGGVYLALNAIALVAQVGLLPRLQRRIGVNGSLLVMPLALLGGSAGLLATAWLLAPPLLRISEGSLRSSIHRVNWEQAYLPLARHQRASAKLLVDGVGARVAEGVAALVMLVWLRVAVGDASLVGRDTKFFAWLLLAATVAWLLLTLRLGRQLAPMPATAVDPRLDIPLPET